MPGKPKQSFFTKFAKHVSNGAGTPWAFSVALAIVIIWAVSGPIFGFSEVWQLVVNTGTTIVTFLMVFVIQTTQNRDTAALQLKLDELLRVTKGAHIILLDLEELGEKDLEHLRSEYEKLAKKARTKLKDEGNDQTDCPPIDLSKIETNA